jgi:hypothetical protein
MVYIWFHGTYAVPHHPSCCITSMGRKYCTDFSGTYRDRPCNCQALIVYKVTVLCTGKHYTGATSQMLKE